MMEEIIEKTYTCRIDNRWMWGLENAMIGITSPTGGYVKIDKWHMDKVTPEQAVVIWKCANQSDRIVELTKNEMQLLVNAEKLIDPKKYEVKAKSLAQRKFETRKKNQHKDHSICNCGGKIIEKDHGKWIGWYCPKCKSGGSRNKSKY